MAACRDVRMSRYETLLLSTSGIVRDHRTAHGTRHSRQRVAGLTVTLRPQPSACTYVQLYPVPPEKAGEEVYNTSVYKQ